MRLDDLIILHANRFRKCTAVIDKHFVGYASLQCIDRGAVDLRYNERHHRITAGWLWPCLPGPRIRFHAAPGCAHWSHRYVAMRGPLLDAWRREGLFPSEPLPWPDGIDAPAAFDAILGDIASASAWGRRRAVNRIEGLLIDLAVARSQAAEAPWLAKARGLLEFASIPIDVPSVAADCGMGSSTFRRRFTLATGMSPRDYAMSARAARAGARLLGGDDPAAKIAADLGFADMSYFIRQFRRSTGLTPARYRTSRP